MRSDSTGIRSELIDWFNGSHNTKLIEHNGKQFWVDHLEDGGYCIQPVADLGRYKKVWNLTKAAEAIRMWK